jgi:hypothetical protein
MADSRADKSGWITTLIVVLVLGAAAVTSALLRWLGDWEQHGWGLSLAERIVWGCCLVAALAVILTRVTLFGWSFRRYFRWPGDGAAPDADKPVSRFRPVRAPWPKSAVASFSNTVVLVSLTGVAVIAWAVLWMLEDVIGDWVYWLVTFIIVSVWWVLCIAMVLTRLALFAWQKRRAVEAKLPGTNGNPAPPGQPATGVQERSDPL